MLHVHRQQLRERLVPVAAGEATRSIVRMLRPGTTIADRYRLDRELGAGGMATVYLANDLKHDRRVAVKVLRPELSAIVGAERFLNEIRTTANLQHPHILPLHDSGEVNGVIFYVMPLVEGESLRDRLTREKQLPVDDAVRIAHDAAEALDYAHRHGVIHRDIKPENILLHDGRALVADFGIALAVSTAGGSTRMTETGMSLGTPHYMSPEQAMGEREITARSDVYALGCVLYEMLSGEPPFTGPTAQAIIAKVVTSDPAPLATLRRTVPPHVAGAVHHALQRLPADRFGSAREFADAITGQGTLRFVPAPHKSVAAIEFTPRALLPWALVAAAAIVAALGWTRSGSDKAPSGQLVRLPLYLADTIRTELLSPLLLAMSPDGARMVLSTGRGGPLNMISLSDPVFRPIRGTEDGGAPALSPDGEELAFTRRSTLYRVPADGGEPVAITDSARSPVWGDRGTLFFIRQGHPYVLRPGSTRPERIAMIDSSQSIRALRVSPLPGEQYVLADHMRADRQNGSLLMIDVGSGRVDSLGIAGSNPAYSPTGHLVYVDSTRAVVAVPFSPRTRRPTGSPVVILSRVRIGYSGLAQYAISQRGDLIALPDSGAHRKQVFLVTSSGEARPVSSEIRGFGWMKISPDGRRAAYEIAEGGSGPWSLWILDIASGFLTRLTNANEAFRPQAWTPDGRNLLHLSGGPAGTRKVMSRPADGTGQEQEVAHFPLGVMQGSIDAAGKRMVTQGRNAISLATLGSSEPARVLFEDATAGPSPSISPDGEFIAYSSAESGRDEVYVRAIDGAGGRVRVSVNGGVQPVWNRTGTAVFYRDDVAMRRAVISRTPSLAVSRRDSLFSTEGYFAGSTMSWGVMPDDQSFLMLRDRTAPTYPVLVLNWPRLFDRTR